MRRTDDTGHFLGIFFAAKEFCRARVGTRFFSPCTVRFVFFPFSSWRPLFFFLSAKEGACLFTIRASSPQGEKKKRDTFPFSCAAPDDAPLLFFFATTLHRGQEEKTNKVFSSASIFNLKRETKLVPDSKLEADLGFFFSCRDFSCGERHPDGLQHEEKKKIQRKKTRERNFL